MCLAGSDDSAEEDQPHALHLVDLGRDADVAGDVPVDVGLLAQRVVADVEEDVQGVGRLQERSQFRDSCHAIITTR